MTTKFIKPAPGRKVRRSDQNHAALRDEGELVNWDPYWERLLIDGDIEVVDQADTEGEKLKRSKQNSGGSE